MGHILFTILVLVSPALATAKKKKKVRRDHWCIRELRRTGTRFKKGPYLKGMRSPVTILNGKLGKIQYMNGRKRARPIMDCRTALALYRTYPIINANGGIKSLLVGKFYSYRYVKNSSRLSRHSLGLAVDIYGIKTSNGKTYMVTGSYQRGLGSGKYCEGKSKSRGARLLRQLACDLDRSQYFKVILTPDSDRDHRDHFHISIYGKGEKRKRKFRTTLLEAQYFGKPWVRKLPKYGYPSRKKVWRIVKARRRQNRRLIKRRYRKKRRRKRKNRKRK
jgi:Extensin-like protein C-terminus